MLYILTNVGAWVVIALLMGGSILIDRKGFRQYHLVDLTLIALLVSVSVVLTNVISYKFIIFSQSIRLALGAFILFVIGMLFGPYFGIIGALAADTIGILVGLGGAYSALFTLDDVLYGFMGAFVWIGNFKKWWIFKTALIYTCTLVFVSFGIDVLYSYTYFGVAGIVTSLIAKAIKIGPEAVLYSSLTVISFITLYEIIKERFYHTIWVLERTKQVLLRRIKKKHDEVNYEKREN